MVMSDGDVGDTCEEEMDLGMVQDIDLGGLRERGQSQPPTRGSPIGVLVEGPRSLL